MSSRPLPSPSPCIQTLPCSPKPGAPLQEGRMGGAHSLSGWPPQKLTVSEFLNRSRSPAWRLNSALRASNNAARAAGELHRFKNKKQHNFFTGQPERECAPPIRPSCSGAPGLGEQGSVWIQGEGEGRGRLGIDNGQNLNYFFNSAYLFGKGDGIMKVSGRI